MTELRISALGPLSIELDGKPLSGLTALKGHALLVYLAVTARPHSRQALAGLLWSDVKEELARTSLRTVLAQVRAAVGDWVQADRHTVWFRRERPHWIDVTDFEEACRRLQKGRPGNDASQKALREDVHLYREDFLTDFRETGAVLFEEWMLGQREHYRRLALDALQALAHDALARNAVDDGIEDARRMLALDPLREEAHRVLMELHAAAGNTIAALRQYDQCVRILGVELGVPPSDDIRALADALKDRRWQDGHQIPQADPDWTREPPGADQPAQPESDPPVPNNLPAALTRLVGRERELAALDELLALGGTRLISIVGPGGIGKTRLSLAVAEREVRARRFAHGVYFVELAPLNDPDHMLPVLAEAIRLPLQSGSGSARTAKEQVLDHLRTKKVLLVLDNVEHLLGGGDLVTEILQTAPGVKILVTARERPHLVGEQVFPVLGLDYGNLERGDPAEACAAMQLFLLSAQRAAPWVDLSAEEGSQAMTICRMVEGLPLGIELAAAWVGLVPLDEIVVELQRSLDILARDRRGVPARHRSIRAAFDTSWQRLDEAEQAVFAALSVFRGGFSRAAAQQVAGATLHQLGDLVTKSLVQFDRARNRYTLHEMARQYAAEKLARDPEKEGQIRDHHSVRYCSFAQSLGQELLGARQIEAIAELECRAENLRTAWQWAAHHRDRQLVAQAMDGLGLFYEWQGRLQDGEAAFQLASDALEADSGADTQCLLGRALAWRSVFAHTQGTASEAEAHLAEARRVLAQVTTDSEELTKAQAFAWYRTGVHAFARDDQQARTGFSRSLALYQRIGHGWGIARSLSGLAQTDADAGNYAEAESRYHAAIALQREIGDRRGEAHSLHRVAILVRNAGRAEEAVRLARQSYRLYLEMGDRTGQAWSGQILAECLSFSGERGEAMEVLRTAETVAAELGDAARLANVYQEQAMMWGRMGRYQDAYDKGEMGLALARRLGQLIRVAWCQIMLSDLDLYAGENEMAATRLQESEQLLTASARGHEMAVVHALQAKVALAQGATARARQLTLASLQLSLRHRDYRLFLGLRALVELLVDAGRIEDAVTAYGHLSKWPNTAEGLFEARIRERLMPIMDRMSPELVDRLLDHAQETDVWDFAAHWVVELEQMAETDAVSRR